MCRGLTHAFMISACSSIRLPSPITMGPASAMIRALGWITVLGPVKRMVGRVDQGSLCFKQHRRWLRGGRDSGEEHFLKYVPGTTQGTLRMLSPQLLSWAFGAKSQTKVSGDSPGVGARQPWLALYVEGPVISAAKGRWWKYQARCCKDSMR